VLENSKRAHKNRKKNCKLFKINKSNAVSVEMTASKPYLSICVVGLGIVVKCTALSFFLWCIVWNPNCCINRILPVCLWLPDRKMIWKVIYYNRFANYTKCIVTTKNKLQFDSSVRRQSHKGPVIRATFFFNLSCNIVAVQVETLCCAYYHLRDQLVLQQNILLQISGILCV